MWDIKNEQRLSQKLQYWIDVYGVPTISLKRQVFYDVLKRVYPNMPNVTIEALLNNAYPQTCKEKEAAQKAQEILTQTA